MDKIKNSLDQIKNYYGSVLDTNKDLKTNACCTSESIPPYLRDGLTKINGEILDKFYGCGSPIPPDLDGKTVLDLGCGTGRDVYLTSYLVGSHGKALGIDMTDEQLQVANKYIDSQMEIFEYSQPNVEFHKGYIEDLSFLEDKSVDVVTSNCVINLSPDKLRVFSEIFRVLKTGGELYFSDVFADRRIPDEIREDAVLQGECLSGAMYMEDFRRLIKSLGLNDYRLISQSPIEIKNQEVVEKIGMVNFKSITIRIFKLPTLEDVCEDYGQAAVYLGTIPEFPHRFTLDDHHVFETGKVEPVCGNTASMLEETRFGNHFKIVGDRSTHFGLFDCEPKTESDQSSSNGACC